MPIEGVPVGFRRRAEFLIFLQLCRVCRFPFARLIVRRIIDRWFRCDNLRIGRACLSDDRRHIAVEVDERLAPVECGRGLQIGLRSEEHTSELQSLMRISYAVFCLNKKTSMTEVKKPSSCTST